MTTNLLGFDALDYNVVYAQMGRGKMERTVAFAMAGIAATLSKLAFDACMFNSQLRVYQAARPVHDGF